MDSRVMDIVDIAPMVQHKRYRQCLEKKLKTDSTLKTETDAHLDKTITYH